ncbi:MAG: hypothetical protein F6K31_11810 [Symploca sp. SIO2G7]|nr:hypothetical protein [Symploca sp. SIO2G7]
MQARSQGLSQLGLGRQAGQLDKQAAILQQQLSFQQESVNLERFIEKEQLAADEAARLRENLMSLNEITLENIEKQFDPLTEVLTSTKSSFQTFFSDLISGSKSIGDAFNGLVDSIVNNLANMASQWLTDELFGELFGKLGMVEGDVGVGSTDGFFGGSPDGQSQFGLQGTSPATPMFVNVVNTDMLGGLFGGGEGNGDSGFFSGILPNSGEFSIFGGETKFNTNNPFPVDVIQAAPDAFSGVANILGGLFGGGSGGGLGGIISSVASLVGGGGSGGIGGLLSGVLSIFGGGFADGGIVGIEGRASKSLSDAIAREGFGAQVVVAKRGELILPTETTRKFYQLGLDRVLNFNQGGIVGGGVAPSFAGVGGGGNISVSSPVTINVNSESKVNSAQFKAAHEAMTRQLIRQESRPGGSLYQRR